MTISKTYVPWSGPDSKILFVGEAPGAAEESERLPFVGESGKLLTSCLLRNGLQRDEVKLANLSHYRPLNNKFEELLGTDELKEGIAQLYSYILAVRPNVIVPLGNYPLKYLTGKIGISRYRGSILPFVGDQSIKVIPTYHPSYVLRDRSSYPIFDIDVRRAISDSKFPEFNIPIREYIIEPSGLELEEITQNLCLCEKISVDIETVKGSTHILCVGFSPQPNLGVCLTPQNADIQIRRILESHAKKIFHFGTFDILQLEANGYIVNNYWWDTLTAQHAMNPELPRGLDFLTSIYTRQPYYKKEGRGELPSDTKAWSMRENKQDVYIYNCKDVCVTMEIQLRQEEEMDHVDRATFDFEMSEFPLVKSISQNGLLRDEERVQILKNELRKKWARKQWALNQLCRKDVNVRSTMLKGILYEYFKLPVKKNRAGGITTDEDAIVSLIGYCKDQQGKMKSDAGKLDWEIKLTVCKLILEIRGFRQLLSNYINKSVSEDGRIHSTYKHAVVETGRWSCEKFVDGSGINAQTVPREAIEITSEGQEAVIVEEEEEEEEEVENVLD